MDRDVREVQVKNREREEKKDKIISDLETVIVRLREEIAEVRALKGLFIRRPSSSITYESTTINANPFIKDKI